MDRRKIFFSIVLVGWVYLSSPNSGIVGDDLDNSKVLKVLERIASEGKRSTRVNRLYKADNKNNIVELNLRNQQLNDGDLIVFSLLEHLQVLDISRTNVTNDQLRQLSRFANLKRLNLNGNKIDSAGVGHLRMMVQLESLDLGRTGIDDSALDTCRTLNNLRQLGLRGCKITSQGLTMISKLKNLQFLDLGDTDLSDSCVDLLVKFPKLRSLTLDETKITNDGLKRLATSPALAWIATPDLTVKEWVSRIKKKNPDGLNEMSPVGLRIPLDGTFSKEKIFKKEQQAKDKAENRHRYRAEFYWEVDGRKPATLYAELRVERGHVSIMGMGIVE